MMYLRNLATVDTSSNDSLQYIAKIIHIDCIFLYRYRKAASTDNIITRRYLDQTPAEDFIKQRRRPRPYIKLDTRNTAINNRNSYQNLEIGSPNRSHEPIKDLDFSSGTSSNATLDPAELPPFTKNFYKLHPETEAFPDVSQMHVHTCVPLKCSS